jgi:uncharacterized protein YndB with AHSA1/START domain
MAERSRGYAHRVDIDAEAGLVWRALTESEPLARWYCARTTIRAQTGGTFSANIDRFTQIEALIDVFEPRRRLRLILLPTPTLPPAETALVIDIILEAQRERTIVRVLGSGVPASSDWDGPFLQLRTLWERAMARLKVFVERKMTE